MMKNPFPNLLHKGEGKFNGLCLLTGRILSIFSPLVGGVRGGGFVSFFFIILYFSLILCFNSIASEGFYAKITADNINVRSDSSVSSQIICTVKKSETVEVVLEKYDWYKIKLPKTAPVFVKKELIACIDTKTAKAVKDNINVRLLPSESSVVLGNISKNEVLNILEDKGDWYKIEPTDNSFGWIHKKFVEKNPLTLYPLPEGERVGVRGNIISLEQTASVVSASGVSDIEGIIQPYGKVINRIATHKLITKDYDVFLLRGNPDNLNTLAYHRVKITGKPLSRQKQKYPVIEVVKMETLD